jgi:hypothetical protein
MVLGSVAMDPIVARVDSCECLRMKFWYEAC